MASKLKRYPDWDQRFYTAAVSDRDLEHSWGSNDCVTFAAKCVEALTGADIIEDVRGRYRSKSGALRIMKKLGFEDLGDLVASRLPEIEPSCAWRGDIVLCDGSHHEGDFLAVAYGTSCVAPGPNGLVHAPRSQIKRAFAVGER